MQAERPHRQIQARIAIRPHQYHRSPALPRQGACPAISNRHEALTNLAGALGHAGARCDETAPLPVIAKQHAAAQTHHWAGLCILVQRACM